MRILVYSVVAFILAGCSPGRDTVQISPSGEYRAWLSINRHSDGGHIWVVNIAAGEDDIELLEFMNDYPAGLMAYIEWDDHDRLWFYSSDDGRYFYWEKTGIVWKAFSWSVQESSLLNPPQTLRQGNERN